MQQNEFSLEIQPRFCETDALGHINNTVFPVWFEAAREPIFKIFNPQQDLSQWNLIIAGFNVNFFAPTYFATDVTVKTWVSRIGNSSFELTQSCWQNGKKTVEATTSVVHYDYNIDKSVPLSDAIREQLGLLTGK